MTTQWSQPPKKSIFQIGFHTNLFTVFENSPYFQYVAKNRLSNETRNKFLQASKYGSYALGKQQPDSSQKLADNPNIVWFFQN